MKNLSWSIMALACLSALVMAVSGDDLIASELPGIIIAPPPPPPPPPKILRGDCDNDGCDSTPADTLFLLNFLKDPSVQAYNEDALDINDDGYVNWVDLRQLVNWITTWDAQYKPAPPYPSKDVDPTADHLPGAFIRGDCNLDGETTFADEVMLVNYLNHHISGFPNRYLDGFDIDDDGYIGYYDDLYYEAFLAGGPAPPPPHPDLGRDPTSDNLTDLRKMLRGDCNEDGYDSTPADTLFLLQFLTDPSVEAPNEDALDINDDGYINRADLRQLVNWITGGGCDYEPAPPYPSRDVDTTPDYLGYPTDVFIRGDCDRDGIVERNNDGDDFTVLQDYLNTQEYPYRNLDALDINDDGDVDVLDQYALTDDNYLIPLPYPAPAYDPTPDDLGNFGLGKSTVNSSSSLPNQFILYQNYPNPFNPKTDINYFLPEAEYVKLEVYNTLGQKVKTLVSEEQSAGSHSIRWNGSSLASGLYLYRLQAGDFTATQRMLLLK